ncbi:serine hydrolase domain-containing protein [Mycobacterium sp. BMJ-28]
MTPLLRDGGLGDRVSVVRVNGGVLAEAHYGAQSDTIYEIGSITKTMTALLFAHAVESGGLRPETTLGSLLDLDGSPAASVTLEELASHRSGLPRIAARHRDRVSAVLAVLQHRNPYTANVATLLTQARAANLTGRGDFSYSNLGFALLGQALAADAGIGYPQLLHRRLFERLDMTQSTTPLTADDLPPGAPTGYSANGKNEQAWTMNAYAPAGGVRSTPADMARYTQALLDCQAPGNSALDPRWEASNGTRVGYAWFTDRIGEVTVTWHNGATAGFSSMLALHRGHAAAVVLLANTAVALDEIAIRILLNAA